MKKNYYEPLLKLLQAWHVFEVLLVIRIMPPRKDSRLVTNFSDSGKLCEIIKIQSGPDYIYKPAQSGQRRARRPAQRSQRPAQTPAQRNNDVLKLPTQTALSFRTIYDRLVEAIETGELQNYWIVVLADIQPGVVTVENLRYLSGGKWGVIYVNNKNNVKYIRQPDKTIVRQSDNTSSIISKQQLRTEVKYALSQGIRVRASFLQYYGLDPYTGNNSPVNTMQPAQNTDDPNWQFDDYFFAH
jgi:hypothetical protein